MLKSYDIIYTYLHEKKLGYFEMVDDLEELFKKQYASEIVKANDKDEAIKIFNGKHKEYTHILSIRALDTLKFCNKGREL